MPNRRRKIIIEMMKDAEELGLYDEEFNQNEK
jgi:hypothetical protein